MASPTRRYSEALLMVTEEEGSTAAVEADLGLLGSALAESGLPTLLEDPGVPSSRKASVLKGLLSGEGRSPHPTTLRFLHLCLRKRRQALLPRICEAFHRGALECRGQIEGTLKTPKPMEPSDLQALSEVLSKKIGKSVLLDTAPDESLLGGFRVLVGDTLFDASLKGQIEALGRKLKGVQIGDL